MEILSEKWWIYAFFTPNLRKIVEEYTRFALVYPISGDEICFFALFRVSVEKTSFFRFE